MTWRIRLTGASGYIGLMLKKTIEQEAHQVTAFSRNAQGVEHMDLIDDSSIDMLNLEGVDAVIHLAGLAHDVSNDAKSAFERYDLANHVATKKLAEKAVASGVKQFVFISTMKVLGAYSASEQSFATDSPYQADSAYTQSKMSAELAVKEVLESSGCAYTIIRPALVYDVDAKGNFANLLGLCSLPIPIPLGLASAPRQMLARATLVEFIIACLNNPKAYNQLFNVADKELLSTQQIVAALREGMGKSANLLPMPPLLMKFATQLINKPQWYEQLFQPFLVDISNAESIMSFDDKGGYSKLVEVGRAYKERVNP